MHLVASQITKNGKMSPLLFHIFPGIGIKQEVLRKDTRILGTKGLTLRMNLPFSSDALFHKKVKKCQEPPFVSTFNHSNFHHSTLIPRPLLRLAVNHPIAAILLDSASKLCLVCGMTSPICLLPTSTVCLLTLAGAVLYLSKTTNMLFMLQVFEEQTTVEKQS